MLTFLKFPVQKSHVITIIIILLIVTFAQCKRKSSIQLRKYYPTIRDNVDHSNIDYNFLITGGYRPQEHNLTKYLVSISREKFVKFFGDGHFCGGAIIKPNVIATAAHCIKKEMYGLQMVRSVIVIAGSPNRLVKTPKTQIMKVKRYVVYDSSVMGETADLALIILQKDLIIDNITTAVLPLPHKKPSPNMKCIVLGWGRIFEHGPMPAEVLYVDLDLWDDRRCSTYDAFYLPSLLCAGVPSDPDRDSCAGDSGGPLICNEQLYGVVSFGIGCGTPGFPGFYTNVYRYMNWIEDNRADSLVISYILYVYMICIYLFLS